MPSAKNKTAHPVPGTIEAGVYGYVVKYFRKLGFGAPSLPSLHPSPAPAPLIWLP